MFYYAENMIEVNPARAGMIRLDLPPTWAAYRKPRASGDDPALSAVVSDMCR